VTWLRFEPPQILNFYFDAYLGPDPADYFDADPDPAFHSDADLVRIRNRNPASIVYCFLAVCVHF